MAGESDQSITRVLFCGPYFSASHVYTREYVENNPFIKVLNFMHSLLFFPGSELCFSVLVACPCWVSMFLSLFSRHV